MKIDVVGKAFARARSRLGVGIAIQAKAGGIFRRVIEDSAPPFILPDTDSILVIVDVIVLKCRQVAKMG